MRQTSAPGFRNSSIMRLSPARAPTRRSYSPPHRTIMSDLLQTVREGRLLRLTLNRPDKRNALNLDLCRALADAIDHASRDRSLSVILLTAVGKTFCAGMDLAE